MELEEQKILKRLRKAKDEGNLDQLIIQNQKLGEIRCNQGRFDEALTVFKEELRACKALGSIIRTAVAHRMVGEAYVDVGEMKKALKHQYKYLELAKTAGDSVEEQRAQATLGRTQLCLAESDISEKEVNTALAEAKTAFLKSLAICESLQGISRRDQIEMRARLVLNLGLVYDMQGDVTKSMEMLRKAVDLCRNNELWEDLVRCLGSLGMARHRHGDCAGSLESLGQALDVASRLSAEERVARTCDILSWKADVFFTLGDFLAAKQALHKAYKLKAPMEGVRQSIEKHLRVAVVALQSEKQLQEVDEEDLIHRKKLYETIADCCVEVKSLSKALEYYHKMQESSERLGDTGSAMSSALVSLALTYKDNKQYSEAITYFKKDFDLWDENPKEACRSLLNIASVMDLRGDSASEQFQTLDRARTLATISRDGKLMVEVLGYLATCHRSHGNIETAVDLEKEQETLRTEFGPELSCSQDEVEQEEIGCNVELETLTDLSEDEEEVRQGLTRRRRPQRGLVVKRNEVGETALHRACITGNVDQVQMLLGQNHPVNPRDNCGWLPLHEAANHGHTQIVAMLLDKGAIIADRGGTGCAGITPLHDAAANGYLDTVALLLERGAPVAVKTNDGDTPLDALKGWHERIDSSLSEEEENEFKELCYKMKRALDRSGHSTEDKKSNVQSKNKKEDNFRSIQQNGCSSPQFSGRARRDSPSPEHSRKRSSNEGKVLRPVSKKTKLLSNHLDSDSDTERINRPTGSLRRNVDALPFTCSSDEEQKIDYDIIDSDSENESRIMKESRIASSAEFSKREESSATADYAKVMETLRRKNKQTHKVAGPSLAPVNRPGLLEENDIVKDWLEDDLGYGSVKLTQPTKRRRILRTQKIDLWVDKRSSSPIFQSTSSPSPESFIPSSPPSSPFKETQSSVKMSSPVKVSQRLSDPIEILSLRVRVKDKLLLVPVPSRDLTIGWLADEVSRRYYCLEGLMPKLTLLTRDGALLTPTDPVTLVLVSKDGEPEVQANVESLTLPPVTERYQQACNTMQCDVDSHLTKCLEACQVTLSLDMANLTLGKQLTPLFKALSRQTSLRELDLSGVGLGDTGVESLCGVLPHLEQLASLDISCNNITNEGLTLLANVISTGQHLKALNSFLLNHNRLETSGIRTLGPILEGLRALTRLEMRDCELELLEDGAIDILPVLCVEGLKIFDISYNPLGCSGVAYFISRINAWQLSRLALAHTTSPYQNKDEDSSIAREVALLFQRSVTDGGGQNGTLSKLDLSGCDLGDQDVYELLRTLEESGLHVEQLILSNNPKLGALALRCLFQHQPTIPSLNLLGCPLMLFDLTENDLPQGLVSLLISVSKPGDRTALARKWSVAQGVNAEVRFGPGGLTHLRCVM